MKTSESKHLTVPLAATVCDKLITYSILWDCRLSGHWLDVCTAALQMLWGCCSLTTGFVATSGSTHCQVPMSHHWKMGFLFYTLAQRLTLWFAWPLPHWWPHSRALPPIMLCFCATVSLGWSVITIHLLSQMHCCAMSQYTRCRGRGVKMDRCADRWKRWLQSFTWLTCLLTADWLRELPFIHHYLHTSNQRVTST